MITILGAGLSGISASYHLGHDNCLVFEKNTHPGGHIYSYQKEGCTWDEGPHVSFTKHSYVKELFEKTSKGRWHEFPAEVSNYYKSSWIPHPAQSNMGAIPQPLKDQCWQDFLKSREEIMADFKPASYEEWLKAAFGQFFYETFSKVYTQKYWTLSPQHLTTDWVGERVFYPDIKDVEKGYLNKQDRNTHYITKFRYPDSGGYFSYAKAMTEGMRIEYNKELDRISFKNKELYFTDGECHTYDRLISTIPLPELIIKSDAPQDVKAAADALSCSSLLLVNVVVNHTQKRPDHWMYVYDPEKYSTRISFLEKLSETNAGSGQSAIQVEVYFSKYKPITESFEQIAECVKEELVEMGLVLNQSSIVSVHTHWVPWANIIFDANRRPSLETIFNWLQSFGYNRIKDELEPMTNWAQRTEQMNGTLMLTGRFAEWKYYWTDDCVLSAKEKAKKWQ